MADYGTRKTDEAVKRAERRLRRVYKEAQRDIAEKLEAWQEAHKAREAKYRKMVADGKMSQADFDAWMRGQVFQGKQWAARKKEIDQVLLNADKAAAKIVNEGKVGVFADNANYIGYGLEHDLRIDSGFTLYDESTVARLIQDDPQILPMPAPGVVKDKAFPYYNRLMSSAITQGILQGETIPQIAKRIMEKTGESSYKSAVRNARTAYTGAQNAGRIEGLHQAQRLGIEVKKKWLATLDDRTRDSHRDLDGQVREVDEPFDSPIGKLRFPGDPEGEPGDVYNCRCALIYEYPQYPSSMERLDNITREKIGDMTYREWEEMKKGGGQEEAETPIKAEHEEVKGDDNLDWLFEQLMQEDAGENEQEEPEPDMTLQRPGRYDMPEADYPKELRLMSYEEERLEAIEHYFDDDYKMPKNMPRIRDDERQIAAGHDEYYNPDILSAQRDALEKRIETATEEIEQKKAAGYKGKTRQESYSDWKRLQRELRGADETEVGAILGAAQVGESGIQYWQRDKKAAERELQVLDFIEKLHRRYTFAKR